jgi:hypothetical protein
VRVTTSPDRAAEVAASSFRVGVVGPVEFTATGAVAVRGPLARVVDNPLVLVAAGHVSAAALDRTARANPSTHFALIGGSVGRNRPPNVAGVEIRAADAASLSGVVAGLVARATGTQHAVVALVGPTEAGLLGAFRRSVSQTADNVSVIGTATGPGAAACKEAALAAIAAGAAAVVATDDTCAEGTSAAASERNVVGEALGDFELPSIAASAVVQAAMSGRYYHREDVVFGFRSGAIGIVRLDPLVPTGVAVQARAAAQRLGEGG